jgi:hypothetical protein
VERKLAGLQEKFVEATEEKAKVPHHYTQSHSFYPSRKREGPYAEG